MKKITLLTLLVTVPFLFFGQVIVIDPGHGYDSNGGNPDGRTATEIVTALEVGLRLDTLITNGCPNWTVYMTRSTPNGWITLSQRCSMSNSWNADYFLSIHCNGGGGTGTETFWCTNNDTDPTPDINFATQIQADMSLIGQWTDRRVVEDNSYIFHLAVLGGTSAIGCLSEIGFVDFASDAAKLNNNTWRDTFASSYFQTFNTIIGNCSTTIVAPPNDDCANAQILTPGVACVPVTGDISNATAGGLAKPSCDGFATPALKDIWYQFVATSPTHKIIVNPSGSFDEVIAVYTSCSAGELFCKDDGGLGVADSINATGLTIGTTYYVRVYDYGSIGPTTPTFNICVTTPNFTTGVNQTDGNNESEIDIFPNPSDGTVLNGILLDEKAIKINVKLHDVIGREVFTKDTPVIDGKFSLSFVNGLNPGMYMLTGIANGKRYTKRVVIK